DPKIKDLFPEIYNIATGSVITANATCGETEPEFYCKLTEHIEREPQCSICDANEACKQHPITYAIDGTRNWWQSPSLQNGKQYEWITITLDLRQIYEVAYVSIRAAISPLPGNWILERSLDGVEYKPWQYYAMTNFECKRWFGLPALHGIPRYKSDDEVICTSYYSRGDDLEDGEIHTSLINGRPSALKPSDTLRYFYTLRNINIGGYCLCNGHAKACKLESTSKLRKCICEHNTCGESCEKCCPLYNQKAYRSSNDDQVFMCEPCNCFGHSNECYYDPVVAEQHKSLNIHGVYEGGGVCINCMHFTTGINCEQCEDGYYRPIGVNQNDSNPCLKCECDDLRMSCIKDDVYLTKGLKPGDCVCKKGYTGPKCRVCENNYKMNAKGECVCKNNAYGRNCDKCLENHWGNPIENGCKFCHCDSKGSKTQQCDMQTGICICNANFTGKYCANFNGTCTDGYYANQSTDGECLPCECDIYGSLSNRCDKNSGECECRPPNSGPKCKNCASLHIYTECGCKLCNESCFQDLFEKVLQLEQSIAGFDVDQIKNLPHTRLANILIRIEEDAKLVEMYVNSVEKADQAMKNVALDFDTKAVIVNMNNTGAKIKENSTNLLIKIREILSKAKNMLDFIKIRFEDIEKLIKFLNEYGINYNVTGAFEDIERLLNISEQILLELEKNDFKLQLNAAHNEYSEAEQLAMKVKVFFVTILPPYNEFQRLNALVYYLNFMSETIDDKVFYSVEKSMRRIKKVNTTYENLLSQLENNNINAEETKTSLEKAKVKIESALNQTNETNRLYEQFLQSKSELEDLTDQLNAQLQFMKKMNAENNSFYLNSCRTHSEQMLKKLNLLQKIIVPTENLSENALKAAKAYQRIIDAIVDAEMAANDAFSSAQKARDQSTFEMDKILAKNKNILEQSTTLSDFVSNLNSSLSSQKSSTKVIENDLKSADKRLTSINNHLTINYSRSSLFEAAKILYDATQKLTKVDYEIDVITNRLNNELWPKLDQINVSLPIETSELTNAYESIKNTRNFLKELIRKNETLYQKLNYFELSIKDLRDKISMARQRAAGIRTVSLTSAYPNEICVRSFQSEAKPSTTSNIQLVYSTRVSYKNALLFFISSTINQDFMAIELFNRKIRFLWNAGGGTQVIEHNSTIETLNLLKPRERQWYKIEVNKISNIVTLSVLKMSGDSLKSDDKIAEGSSSAKYLRMDFDVNANLFIGGFPKNFKAPDEVQVRSFSGCLSEIVFDGKRIPLWNFKMNVGCGACEEGVKETKDPNVCKFSGEKSYAMVPQIKRYNSRSYFVGLEFKSFDENSILFLTASPDLNDFFAITLEEGQVSFEFKIGSKVHEKLSTNKTYNKGRWTKVSAERAPDLAVLKVENENHEVELDETQWLTMNLRESKLLLGGIPPNFTTQIAVLNIDSNHFSGCMRSIQIDITNLNLVDADSYDVERGCEIANVVSFDGKGFLELKAFSLKEEADFSLTFRTLQTNAVLLLAVNQDETISGESRSYYSIAIIDGSLELKFNGGKGVASLKEEEKINDGNYHTVTISKRHRKITVTIDDKEIGFTRLPQTTNVIEVSEDSGLYLGGVKKSVVIDDMIATNASLIGVIRDFVFNGKLLQLNEPINFKHVKIGREIF
ncbi:Laminin subunit alpha-2-like protein, partial [Dinothrombium tinctorium]